MTSGLVYILRSLMDLYLITFALRLAMQWVRADFRNPIVQFVLTVTNPLVNPLRKLVPPVGKFDLATAIVYLLLLWIFSSVMVNIVCQPAPDILSMLALAAIRGIRLLLSVYLFLVIGYVLLSWITMSAQGGGYNPSLASLANLLDELVRPILAPFRKYIPLIGGLDLSPIALLLVIGALKEVMVSFAVPFGNLGCPVIAFI